MLSVATLLGAGGLAEELAEGSTSAPFAPSLRSGAASMKTSISTSTTSSNGVTLIS
jgi:hypothetical protein